MFQYLSIQLHSSQLAVKHDPDERTAENFNNEKGNERTMRLRSGKSLSETNKGERKTKMKSIHKTNSLKSDNIPVEFNRRKIQNLGVGKQESVESVKKIVKEKTILAPDKITKVQSKNDISKSDLTVQVTETGSRVKSRNLIKQGNLNSSPELNRNTKGKNSDAFTMYSKDDGYLANSPVSPNKRKSEMKIETDPKRQKTGLSGEKIQSLSKINERQMKIENKITKQDVFDGVVEYRLGNVTIVSAPSYKQLEQDINPLWTVNGTKTPYRVIFLIFYYFNYYY